MMDIELKKTSVRANTLEKKRYEMLLSSFDSSKRNVAVDMKKSQMYFKQRLKRYKDRQREILSNSSDPSSTSLEEFVLRQLRKRAQLSLASAQTPSRPQTWSHPPSSTLRQHTLSAHPRGRLRGGSAAPQPGSGDNEAGTSPYHRDSDAETSGRGGVCAGGARGSVRLAANSAVAPLGGTQRDTATSEGGESAVVAGGTTREGDADAPDRVPATPNSVSGGSRNYAEDADFAKLSHCRRSKMDLRPCTAWSAVRRTMISQTNSDVNSRDPSPYSKASGGNSNNLRLLQLRGGAMGTPARQIRYLDDEEIEERCTFYRFLLQGYRQLERQSLQRLNDRVDEFCGKQHSHGASPATSLAAISITSPGSSKPTSAKRHGALRKAPSLLKVGLLSLPPGTPPIVYQAMRVSMTPSANLGSARGTAGSAP